MTRTRKALESMEEFESSKLLEGSPHFFELDDAIYKVKTTTQQVNEEAPPTSSFSLVVKAIYSKR